MTPQQCRAARALIGLTRPQLSLLANVGKNTVLYFETGSHRATPKTLMKLRDAFASLSIRFINDGDGIGVQRDLSFDDGEALSDPIVPDPAAPRITHRRMRAAGKLFLGVTFPSGQWMSERWMMRRAKRFRLSNPVQPAPSSIFRKRTQRRVQG